MRKIILLFIVSSQFVLAQAPNWSWVKKSTGDINEGFACVTTDSNGNVFAGGSIISDTADFGLGPVTNNGYADYSLIKYDASGTPLWMKNGGGLGNEVVYNLTTDPAGNIYATVSFQSASITFGSYTLTNTATAPTTGVLLPYDVALVKYDTNGNVLWAKKIGGIEEEYPATVTCDALGNVYVTTFSSSPTLTIGNLSVSSTVLNSLIGGALAKIDSSGNTLWIKRFGNDSVYDGFFPLAPVFDATGNFYIVGGFQSETFSLDTVTYQNVEPGLYDGIIVKYNSSGTILWQKALQGNGDDYLGKIVIIQNELFVPYSINALISIGSSTYSYDGINYINNGLSTGGLIKMNNSGQVNGFIINPDLNTFIVTDGVNLYFTGSTNNTSPSYNTYLSKMNTAGQVLWSKPQSGSNRFTTLGLTIDQSGNIIFGGYFGGSNLVLDTTILTNTSSTGYIDAIVAKLSSTTLSTSTFDRDGLVIYPNPTRDFITISTKEAIRKVTILDLNGRVLDTQFDTTVNLTNLTSGIYFLNIETETGISSNKIIKQ